MEIKGILFDKDGTLIDFNSFWIRVAKSVVPEFLKKNQIPADQKHIDLVMEAMGIFGDYVDPNGALAYKSNREIAEGVAESLAGNGIQTDSRQVQEQLVRLFEESIFEQKIPFQTFTDLPELFRRLKAKEIRLGIATADTMVSAKHCVQELQIEELLDYIGADDGTVRPKPEPDMFEAFCQAYGLEPGEVAVVGDTRNDMKFARNCKGKAIGVLSGVSAKEDFEDLADMVIPSVADIFSILEPGEKNEESVEWQKSL